MSFTYPRSLCWFRRDLRLHDHAALFHALKNSASVHCVFVFDTDILDKLPNRSDRRVDFIWQSVLELLSELVKLGSTLHILHGSARQLIPQLALQLKTEAIYCNRDYEPKAIERDNFVAHQLNGEAISFHDFKDQVIFEHDEVLNGSGRPYAVFTAYKNAWLKQLDDFFLRSYPTELNFSRLAQCSSTPLPSLESLGFKPADTGLPCGMSGAGTLFGDFQSRVDSYREARDFPAVNGTSLLSAHMRFGTISIRALARYARRANLVIRADMAGLLPDAVVA